MAPNPVRPVVVIAMLPVDALLVLKLLSSVTAPPKIVMGPAIVVAPPMVIFALLVLFPSISPVKSLPSVNPVNGKLRALLNTRL